MRWISTAIILGLAAATAQGQVTCGAVLSAGTYVMTSDILDCASSPALTLSGGVELDMNAHRLTCVDTTVAGIAMTGGANSIRNGAVSGCSMGLTLGGSGGHSVARMSIVGSAGDGVQVTSDKNTLMTVYAGSNDGKQIALSGNGNKLTRCNTRGGTAGVQVNGDKNKISDSTASSSDIGFFVETGAGNSFKNCIALRNDGDGFQSAGSATKIASCSAIENGDDGFSLGGTGHVVTKSVGLENSYGLTAGFDNGDCVGCSLTANRVIGTGGWNLHAYGSDTTVAKNEVSGAGTVGIEVGGGTDMIDGVKVTGNVALVSATYGINVNDEAATVTKNTVVGSGTADLQDASATCSNNDWSDNIYATRVQGCEQ